MLNPAMKFRVALEKMEQEDKLYNDYFMEKEKVQKRICHSRFTDWRTIEIFGLFLVIFYNFTLVVSASTSLSSYKCYEEI